MSDESKTPSESDFARAKKKMAQRLEKGAKAKNAILSYLPQHVPCHDIWVWMSDKECNVSYVFPTNADLENSGGEIQRLVETIVRDAAEGMDGLGFSIDYHSHEYVMKKFNGNYGQYFR